MTRLYTGLWACLSLAATLFGVWVVLRPWWPTDNASLGLTLLVFGVQPIGALWMLYHSIRYEERPLPFVFLAFIPYAFLWYYFERVRKMAHREREA